MGYNSDDACRRERRIVKRIDCNEKRSFYCIDFGCCRGYIYGVRYVKSPVDTMTAQAQTKRGAEFPGEGIVYDEAVYTCENSGTFYSYTPEGEKSR